jgi:capsule polysaccharide export protein KpsE/RkpR
MKSFKELFTEQEDKLDKVAANATDTVNYANSKIKSGVAKVTKASDDLKGVKDFGSGTNQTQVKGILNAIIDGSQEVLNNLGK